MTLRAARRQARTALVAVTLVLLTVAGHTAGGGSTPDVVGLAFAIVLATALAFAASGHRLGILRLLGLLLGGQALLHVVLTLAGGHGHDAPAAAPGGAAMLAGHVAAAAIAAVVVAHADELIDRWAGLLRAALGAAPAPCSPVGLTDRVPTSDPLLHGTIDGLRHQVTRRGPPSVRVFSPA